SRFVTRWQVPTVPYDYYRPNARKRTSLRANAQATVSRTLDVTISSGFITSSERLPQTDNNTTGLLSNALGGPGHFNNWRFINDTIPIYGYRLFTPDEMVSEVVSQDINRFIGSGTVNWHPNAWLTGRAIARIDVPSAVRGDENSAFGQDFKAAYYPKLSVSYVISDEPSFPAVSWLSNLRLRGAIGASGQQPGSTDAIAFYAPTTATLDGQNKAAIVFSSIGNPALRPERATEIELGFDAALVDNRVNLQFTYYHKRAKDALIARTVAPSVGASATRFENLGAVRNAGVELSVNAILLNRPSLGRDVTFNASHNSNVIEDMGGVPPIVGTTIQERRGYPI